MSDTVGLVLCQLFHVCCAICRYNRSVKKEDLGFTGEGDYSEARRCGAGRNERKRRRKERGKREERKVWACDGIKG